MDTAIPAALLLFALFLWRAILRIQRTETQRRVRSYRADVVRQAARRGGDAEEDALELWKLRSSGFRASRRAVMSSHEMTAYRWDKASAVIKHLRLDPAKHSYAEGVDRLQQFYADQAQLATRPSFVPPVE